MAQILWQETYDRGLQNELPVRPRCLTYQTGFITRTANELDRARRVAHWVVVTALIAVAVGPTGCVTAPAYPGYDAGYGAGCAVGSNTYSSGIVPAAYSSGHGSYDVNTSRLYLQQPAPVHSQSQPIYSQSNYSPCPNNGDPSHRAPASNRYDVAEYVEAVPVRGQSGGMGAIPGSVVGGLFGHQVNDGRDNTTATIGGAVVDAMAGNTVGGNTVIGQTYRTTTRLNDNSRIILTQNNPNGPRAGDRTHIENNMTMPYQPLPTQERSRQPQKRRGLTDIVEAMTPQ